MGLVGLGLAALAPLPSGASQVVDVRLGRHPGYTRVVIELDEAAPYRIDRYSDPAVLYVAVDAAAEAEALASRSGLVESIEVEPTQGTSVARIRLRETNPQILERVFSNPPRIVLDLRPAEAAPQVAGVTPEAAPASGEAKSVGSAGEAREPRPAAARPETAEAVVPEASAADPRQPDAPPAAVERARPSRASRPAAAARESREPPAAMPGPDPAPPVSSPGPEEGRLGDWRVGATAIFAAVAAGGLFALARSRPRARRARDLRAGPAVRREMPPVPEVVELLPEDPPEAEQAPRNEEPSAEARALGEIPGTEARADEDRTPRLEAPRPERQAKSAPEEEDRVGALAGGTTMASMSRER
jgi:hypothetical protein